MNDAIGIKGPHEGGRGAQQQSQSPAYDFGALDDALHGPQADRTQHGRSPRTLQQRVTGSLPPPEERFPDQRLSIIIRVARAAYVPPGVTARTHTSAHLLTAETTWGDLPAVARDPLVVSSALAERIEPTR